MKPWKAEPIMLRTGKIMVYCLKLTAWRYKAVLEGHQNLTDADNVLDLPVTCASTY